MATKTTLPAQPVIDAAYEASVGIYKSYSGRGMYGDTCFGIVGTFGGLAKFLVALDRKFNEDGDFDDTVNEMANHLSSDNMGLDTIFYFRGYELDGDVPDED